MSPIMSLCAYHVTYYVTGRLLCHYYAPITVHLEVAVRILQQAQEPVQVTTVGHQQLHPRDLARPAHTHQDHTRSRID